MIKHLDAVSLSIGEWMERLRRAPFGLAGNVVALAIGCFNAVFDFGDCKEASTENTTPRLDSTFLPRI